MLIIYHKNYFLKVFFLALYDFMMLLLFYIEE